MISTLTDTLPSVRFCSCHNKSWSCKLRPKPCDTICTPPMPLTVSMHHTPLHCCLIMVFITITPCSFPYWHLRIPAPFTSILRPCHLLICLSSPASTTDACPLDPSWACTSLSSSTMHELGPCSGSHPEGYGLVIGLSSLHVILTLLS